MGSGGGGSGTQTVVNELSPEQRAMISESMQAGRENILFNPQSYYPGATIAQPGANTNEYLRQLWNYGMGPSPSDLEMNRYAQNVIGGQYAPGSSFFTGMYDSAVAPMRNAYNQAMWYSTAGGQGLADQAALLNQFGSSYDANRFRSQIDYLNQIGSSDEANRLRSQADLLNQFGLSNESQRLINQANYLNQLADASGYGSGGFNAAYEAATNRIIPQLQSQIAASGRSGSGIEQGLVTRELGDAFAGLYGEEQQRKLAALQAAGGLLGTQSQQVIGAQQAAGGLLGTLGQQVLAGRQAAGGLQGDLNQQILAAQQAAGGLLGNIESLRMDALGTAGNIGANMGDMYSTLANAAFQRQLGAAQTLPVLGNELQISRFNAMGDVGRYLDDQSQAYINDQIARWNFEQQEPWMRAQAFAGLLSGLPQLGSTQTSTTPYPRTSRAGGALGGGLSGASLGGSIGGPWGAAIGGLGGAILGAFI
jgi:hypothetical protein